MEASSIERGAGDSVWGRPAQAPGLGTLEPDRGRHVGCRGGHWGAGGVGDSVAGWHHPAPTVTHAPGALILQGVISLLEISLLTQAFKPTALGWFSQGGHTTCRIHPRGGSLGLGVLAPFSLAFSSSCSIPTAECTHLRCPCSDFSMARAAPV